MDHLATSSPEPKNVYYLQDLLPEGSGAVSPTPCLRLAEEPLLINRGTDFAPEYEEVLSPVLELSFRYGTVTLRAGDERERFFVAHGGALAQVGRDRLAEAQSRRLLEGFGAVELGCLEHVEPAFGSEADYVIRLDGDVHAYCVFGAYAVPQLRRLGWEIEIAGDYSYQVVATDAPWFAELKRDQEAEDWFTLELGIEVDGQRVSVLPALLELLETSPDLDHLDTLVRRCRRGVALETGHHRYLVVPPERLRPVLEVLRQLYSGPQAVKRVSAEDGLALQISGGQCASLAALEDAFTSGGTSVVWSGSEDVVAQGRRLEALSQQVLQQAPEPSQLDDLRANLRPYQQAGLTWLQGLRSLSMGGVLADDMGLGKTLQTIAHLLVEKRSGRADLPSLVVAPTSLMGNWQRELSKFAPTLSVLVLHGPRRHQLIGRIPTVDVVVTSYPVLTRDDGAITSHSYHLVVLDEAQAIKNPRSQAHRAVQGLQSRHRLCLTGTPLENNLGELWSLFAFLVPGLLGTMQGYRERFSHPIEADGNDERLELLRRRVAPFILRRMKDEVAKELPPKTEIVLPVEFDDSQRDLYESIRVAAHAEVRKVIRQRGLSASTVTVLDALMKLRQVCCDPRLVAVEAAEKVRSSAKFSACIGVIQRQLGEGRRILVFSQFTSMLALIAKELEQRGVKFVVLTGSTANRQQPVDAFQNGLADVFLISLKAGGTGLNLTRADTVIHYDPWWNPAAQAQATDRAYRIGQTQPVFVYNLIVAGSVEERMLALQQHKRHLASTLLGRPTEAGLGLDLEDLDNLFAPLD